MKCDENPYKDACYENIDNKDDIHNEMTDTLTGQAWSQSHYNLSKSKG
jgi:hypothetical protein